MNIKEKAAKIIADTQIVTVASVDENGYPRPVAMVKLKNEGNVIYVSTGTSSAKTAHFKSNPKAGISIISGDDSVVFTGKMEIVTDENVKRALWSDWMLPHFPGGVNDPEYCVLKFTPISEVLWIDNIFIKDGKYVYRFCQSCGMPMPTDDLLGTNEDGSANQDYCHYCFQKGVYTQDCTMDEMIAHCVQFLGEFNKENNTSFSKEEAIKQMQLYFPQLKRWAK